MGTGGVLQRLVKRCLVCGHGEKEIDIISHWCFSGLLSLKHVVSKDSGSFCSGCIFTSNLNKVPKSKWKDNFFYTRTSPDIIVTLVGPKVSTNQPFMKAVKDTLGGTGVRLLDALTVTWAITKNLGNESINYFLIYSVYNYHGSGKPLGS